MVESRIRAAAKGDVEALANLMTELGYPTSVEDMGRRFEEISIDLSYGTLVAERGGRVVGMAGLHLERNYEKDGNCARIMAFVVAPRTARPGCRADPDPCSGRLGQAKRRHRRHADYPQTPHRGAPLLP
jgi:N-acetylglutamate synthase-like GNAT family acetyltransferase